MKNTQMTVIKKTSVLYLAHFMHRPSFYVDNNWIEEICGRNKILGPAATTGNNYINTPGILLNAICFVKVEQVEYV